MLERYVEVKRLRAPRTPRRPPAKGRCRPRATSSSVGFAAREGRDFYWRQLKDMKGSANEKSMSPDGPVLDVVGLCGWTPARAHSACSGDRVQIAGYLGKSDRFDGAVADFAVAHADQHQGDYAALCAAWVKSGRVAADSGA